MTATSEPKFSAFQLELMKAWSEYLVDSVQRTVLFWDVMRQARQHLSGKRRQGRAAGLALRL